MSHEPYNLVSPPFACGVSWLHNALLALDVKVTNKVWDHWLTGPRGEVTMGPTALQHLKWSLPILHARQSFKFPEQKEVTQEHRLDFAAAGAHPTILFVRDPRDAIYSLYRRDYEKHYDFHTYLKRPDEWPDHFPGVFQLPPLHTFTYFSFYWLAMRAHMPVKLVRFEEVKRTPAASLTDILDFLGVARTREQINESISSSDIKNAFLGMRKMEVETNREWKTIRKGKIGEWKEVYSDAALVDLGEVLDYALSQLGYKSETRQSPPTWPFDDCKIGISAIFSPEVADVVIAWLSMVERGEELRPQTVVDTFKLQSFLDYKLLQLGTVLLAIYYVRSIFPDTSISQARTALNVFVNLNVRLIDQWQIQAATWFCLCRIEAATAKPIVSNADNIWKSNPELRKLVYG